MARRLFAPAVAALVLIAAMALTPHDVVSLDHKLSLDPDLGLSPMGRIARGDDPIPTVVTPPGGPTRQAPMPSPQSAGGSDRLVHDPNAADFQSETTIARNGDWIVVGYNDIRGFAYADPRVSGYSYSLDDGATWTDGGQLPATGNGDAVLGDPDVKTWTDGLGTRYFAYSSLYRLNDGRSSLCVQVSTDGGVTWTAPREVTAATTSTDFADKEFIDFDPDTERLFVSWTNFPNAGLQTIRTAYSDDLGLTWSTPTIFSSSGQGSVPRAAANSDNVYITWTVGSAMWFVRSVNNGVSWGAPMAIATGLSSPMNPYGSDRIGNHPSMDVDPTTGAVYVVYASRNLSPDFGDIYFTRSTDGGVSFTPPAAINASPGSDRVQFFPSVCADETDGSVSVIWYDQRSGTGTSDLTELVHTHSVDAGATWTCPAALSDQPFHAEAGNTTSQPNIGDYNQCVSSGGTLYTSFAKTDRPSPLTYSPDTYVDISPGTGEGPAPLAIRDYSIGDSGCFPDNGFIEPGETILLTLTIENVGGCGGIGNVFATLGTTTPGITITVADATFPGLPAIASSSVNSTPFAFTVDPGMACGTPIDFTVDYVTDLFGPGSLPFDGVLRIGHPVATVLLSEDFDGVTAPALPAGWTSITAAGAANPWVTSTTFAASGSNAAFCADIGTTSLNQLMSPFLAIPAGVTTVRVEVDETHNMEINTERQAWDGGLMRVYIGGPRYLSAAVGVMDPFYPWQMLRQQSADQPMQDLSCWSDDTTPNFTHYTWEYPDAGGQTFRLEFDVSTDPSVGTAGGQFIDNVTVTAIAYACDCDNPTAAGPAALAFDRVTVSPNPFNPETTIRFTLPSRTNVTADVYSVDGRHVRSLAGDRPFDAGAVTLRWNGRDDRGAPAASGVYFVRVRTPLGEHIARAVLLK